MLDRRVAITGVGVVTPLGNTVDVFWAGLMDGACGIRPITYFDTEKFACRIGGQAWDFDPAREIGDVREVKRLDPFAQFAICASRQAVADAGIDFNRLDKSRCGVIIGSGIGGLSTLEVQHEVLINRGPSRVSPFTVPRLMVNAASGNVSILYGLMGPNYAVATACASAANSIGEAARLIRIGGADVMITGASEAAMTRVGMSAFCALKALSTRNDEPLLASRPWDKSRDGFLLSEGAGIVVLEEWEVAKKRGANIYAELIGYGASGDGCHITAPQENGEGASLAMEQALNSAQISADQIDYINAHATSTSLGDLSEVRAVKNTFGSVAGKLAISSIKGATGHLLGASGGIELVASALALKHQVIPPTINLDEPDEECDLDFVPNTPRDAKVNVIMSNSFGFGGHNATLIIRKP